MEQRFFHGDLKPQDLAQGILAEFNRGNLRAQLLQQTDGVALQIATRPGSRSGGQTALTVMFHQAPDGVMVRLGQQEWLSTAASLGRTTIAALINPWNLISRLDDIAQDVSNLQLTEQVWNAIGRCAQAIGASHALSERLRRVSCPYCGTANEVGESACIACGAPLGSEQPSTCSNCGFIVTASETRCPNCGHALVWAPKPTTTTPI
ncbi:MAG: zinc ribbon domain-containing protein [Anaerolineae bacterium]